MSISTKNIGKIIWFLSVLFFSQKIDAQLLTTHPVSTQSEEGFEPCRDTFSIFKRKEFYDIGVILPSWLPIIDKNHVAVLEGKVSYNPVNGSNGPHISHEDLPFYHYTHDVGFDVIPDKTPDSKYTHLQPYLIYHKENGHDTVLQYAIHCEWETGMGAGNKINPFRDINDEGRSGGFLTAGHERGDIIWNIPTAGDWVHVEGNYVWDRGHPPSKAEIHPPRMLAIKRALPEQITIGDSSVKYTTRVDVFASADGGALVNNRFNAPAFVRKVNMSSKDYTFTVAVTLPRPSVNSKLRAEVVRRKADDFSMGEIIELNSDSATATITIPWKTRNANDLEIYARTIYLYWDEGRGIEATLPIDAYKVKMEGLRFRRLSDYLSKAEIRLWLNVGSNWVFVNDFFAKKGKILTKGLGKTRKKKWELENEFVVYVPRGEKFRVLISGWEADGVDHLAGNLLDPRSTCDRKTKKFIKDRLFSFRNMLLKGCMDDQFGEISQLHSYDRLGRNDRFVNAPKEGYNEDPCPFSKYPLKDRYFISYSIEKIN